MFYKLVEHTAVKELLSSEIKHERLAPFYLFTGPQGVGKALAGKLFAKYVLCHEKHDEDCGCRSCVLFKAGNHPDFLLIAPEGGSEIKVETVDEVRKFLSTRPMLSGRRVVLMEDAERLNQHAQNGLLKSLEEPPPGTAMIFTVSRLEALLETIPSRARLVRFGNLSNSGIREVLSGLSVPAEQVDFLIEAGAGSPGKAFGFSGHSAAVLELVEKYYGGLENRAGTNELSGVVSDALDKLSDNAEGRDFLVEFITALSMKYRRELVRSGSEPLGTVISVLIEAFRAVKQNVTPELITMTLSSRLKRALDGEAVSGREIFI